MVARASCDGRKPYHKRPSRHKVWTSRYKKLLQPSVNGQYVDRSGGRFVGRLATLLVDRLQHQLAQVKISGLKRNTSLCETDVGKKDQKSHYYKSKVKSIYERCT
jgi:hypothetical protein